MDPALIPPESGPHLAPGMATAIAGLRRQLLDIGKRNKLINAPIGKTRAKQITIEDEVSDEIFRILHLEGKSMSFQPSQRGDADPVPEDDDESVFLPIDDLPADQEVAARHTDRKLQTRLTSNQLQKKLLTLYRDAQTLEEEQGVSVLFLALGFLRWFESDSSEIERYAPLILLPADLVRDSARGRFRLIFRDQDLDANLSLRALLSSDFGLTLPDLPEGEAWLPTDYFRRVQTSVSSRDRWRILPNTIELSFFSFAKFLMWKDLDPVGMSQGEADNQLLDRILVGGFEAASGIFAPDENLDHRFPDPKDLGHVLDADTSQTQVIAAAREGRSLVVQGPPGTGKSQTIANIIAAVAADGKTVLFVAEKRAALDVVHKRLERCGLGPLCLELHSHKANRKQVYAELKRTLELGEPRSVNAQRYEHLQQVRDELNEMSALIHKVDEASGMTPYGVIGKIADLTEAQHPRPRFRVPGADTWSAEDFDRRSAAVAALANLTAEHGREREHPWRGIRRRLSLLDRRDLADCIRNGLERLTRARSALRAAADVASVGSADCMAAARAAEQVSELASMPAAVPGLLARKAVLDQPGVVLELFQRVAEVRDLRDLLVSDILESALDLDWTETRIEIGRHGGSWLRWLSGSYRRALARLRSIHRAAFPKDLDQHLATLDRLIEHRSLLRRISTQTHLGREVLGLAWRDEETDLEGPLQAMGWIVAQSERVGTPRGVKRQVESLPPERDLREMGQRLRKAFADLIEAWNAINQLVDLDSKVAFGAESIEEVELGEWKARLSSWQGETDLMDAWPRLEAAARHVADLGLDEIRIRLADGRLSSDVASPTLEFIRAEAVWNRMRAEEPRLEAMDGEERNRKVEAFKNLDQKLQELATREVALKHFRSLPAGSAGQVGIVRGEAAKKVRHMRIRRLLDSAGQAVQAIKPVFLMSPLSVAQFLKAGGLSFDLLLIDEASQVRPADAVGAILRCRQVVVVGDQKQMPPTSFFDRQVGSDDERADLEGIEELQAAQVGDMESILSLCESRGMAGGTLRWHYRSRHPSLIAVSNHEFYDDRLVCPPSPDQGGRESGLSFVHVNGVYHRGKKRNNPREAEVVAEEVLAHARDRPSESLGVVALSVAQRDTIRNRLEFMRSEYPELEAFCKEGNDEEFFVKNLENVQGDERDVILISIGYGKDPGGYMSQHFGPVSGEGGERRLNVLFTRARIRCCVYSSIRHSDIRVDTTKHAGPRVLKRYLKYAETGDLDIPVLTGAEMDSPFEEAVAKALHSYGYRVAAQVGSSGFRIDLAVYDPDDDGRFLLAVECDGARYHSSSWARERDRLRQAVLERKGWTFHRIWSTDWFYNRDTEMKKLLEAIERARLLGHAAVTAQAVPPRVRVERKKATQAKPPEPTPYIEASFAVSGSQVMALHEVEPGFLAASVKRVVETEGPVHIDEVARRLSRIWGYKRTGSRIRAAVQAAARHALARNHIRNLDRTGLQFLDRCDRTGKIKVRDRSGVKSHSLRKVQMFPPTEIRQGILVAVERNIGIGVDECAKEVSRMLGFKALRKDLRGLVARVAEELIAEGDLLESGGDLRLP